MTDLEIARLIQAEFVSPVLGVTEQYLEIHQPVYEDGLIKINRIDREKDEHQVIVYLPVQGEYFYFAVYINTLENKIQNIGTESRNIVRLNITSKIMTSAEMQPFTKLTATQSWNKGDKRNKKAEHKFSCLVFEPNPEADEFEDKLSKLLDFLEPDKTGMTNLISNQNVEAGIQVVMDFHRGNQLLGGAAIDKNSIKRLSDFGLMLDFDFTAWGKPFR